MAKSNVGAQRGIERRNFFGRLPEPLTAEEEARLVAQFRHSRSPQAAARLVEANLRLVVTLARRHDRTGRLLPDLVQEGSLGLIEAVHRFDPDKGARLSTYAGFWIRAFLTKYKMNNARLVRGGQTRASRLAFFRGEPGPSEMSLDARSSSGSTRSLGDQLADEAPSADVLLEQAEVTERAARCTRQVVANLQPSEKTVLQRRLLAEAPEPLRNVGQRMSLSGERVRQIEQRVIAKIRRQYEHADRRAAA
ncbi:MAG TPA: sigma-70 family RNA polymerase sigma factor [Polyangia bacterium]